MQNQWREADDVALQGITDREKTIDALRLQLEKEKENREQLIASPAERIARAESAEETLSQLQSDLELEKSRRKLFETAAREKRLKSRKNYWLNAHNSKNE